MRVIRRAFYRRHRDAFAGGDSNRVLSTVLYLNPSWMPEDGGEMLLYADDELRIDRARAAAVRSPGGVSQRRLPHEVLPTRRTRYSIAGWFRVNGSLGGQIDPPR